MRKVKIILLTLALLFINALLFFQVSSAFSKWSLKTKRFSVTQIFDVPIGAIIPFKIPGEKSDYLVGRISSNIAYPKSDQLKFFSPFQKSVSQPRFLKHITIPRDKSFSKLQEIPHLKNGKPFIPILGVNNRKIILELLTLEGEIEKKVELEDLSIRSTINNISSINNIDIAVIAVDDIDADGKDEMVWRISERFSGLPRGFAVHDPLTGKKKWEFLCAGNPSGAIVKDIDYDGKKEIIFSIWAPHNNISYNGMDDDTSYVGVLDCRGTVKWCKIAGRLYTNIHMVVEDMDQDGTFEIITARHCHAALNPDPGQITIYDALTGESLRSSNFVEVSFENLYVTNMNNDPQPEIITCSRNGMLQIRNQKLEICEEYKDNTDIRLLSIEKVQGYSFPLIFTWYSYDTLRIFNNKLRPIFDYRCPQKKIAFQEPIIPVSDGKITSFVLSTEATYRISPRHSISSQDYLLLLRSHFSPYLLGIIVFNGLLYIGWRQRKKFNARALALIRESSKTNPDWIIKAQEVLHKMKSPLTSILWETEKIDDIMEKKRQSKTFFSKLKGINNAILTDVNEMKLMNHFLMKYLQIQTLHFTSIEIRTVFIELVEKYRTSFSNKFNFPCRFSDTLPPLLADEEQLKEALSIVIDNAIDATPPGGTISIVAEYHKTLPNKKQENIICVTIEDNGCGIAEDKLDKIFEPYFTTKEEGTGIGLAIAGRIIESHGGWIEVESKEKIGTKFALYFPVKSLT